MKTNQLVNYFIFFSFLFSTNIFFSQEYLIKNEDSWHYFDNGYLEENWFEIINFSHWKTGKSPLGYGDKKNNTNTLYYGKNKEKKHITKYFKKRIDISKKYLAYEFKIQRDDGAIVYINGKELFRDNMPNSSINSKTLSISTVKNQEEHTFEQHFFDNSIFKKGENIISVSIHQAYEDSSDCIFSLELIGHENPEILPLVLENKNKTNKELESRIRDLNTKFEFEKVFLQKENLQSANDNLKLLIFLTTVFLILALVTMYIFNENHKKKITLLSDEINKRNVEITEKEKEMITLATNILHYKQYFKEIKADLNGIKTDDRKGIKNILNQINYVLEREEDWEFLKKHFIAVHENFYDNLIKKHPTISETELRHCLFIKLHLLTKEISQILLINPRSVQTARYRIKKKMNLAEDQDLREYLLSL